MIVLATDFGPGPYTGQVQAVLARQAPSVPAISLFEDLPAWDIRAAAYLLPAYTGGFPPGTVFLAVVDPEVGSPQRRPVAVKLDEHWFVGPDNGIFELLARRAGNLEAWQIGVDEQAVSASFHGRDVFAPVAASLATGQLPGHCQPASLTRFDDWPDDYPACIYRDHFGNMMSGIRASSVPGAGVARVAGQSFPRQRTFADVPPGSPLCYENSNGLLELAVNMGAAADLPGVELGVAVELE